MQWAWRSSVILDEAEVRATGGGAALKSCVRAYVIFIDRAATPS
jgi:hypothetical protein